MRIITPICLLFLLSSCGDDSENSTSTNSSGSGPINTATLSGTYRLSSLVCNGERLSISGYQETLVLSGNSGQLQSSTKGCLAKETFHFEITENTAFLESDGVECTTLIEEPLYGGCHLEYYLNNHSIHQQCPSSFPALWGQWTITQTNSSFTMTADGNCTSTYTKI